MIDNDDDLEDIQPDMCDFPEPVPTQSYDEFMARYIAKCEAQAAVTAAIVPAPKFNIIKRGRR